MPHANRVQTPVQHVWVRAAIVVALFTGCAGDLAVPVEKQAAVPARTLPNDRAAPVAASLRDVMATNALVGRRVRVRGRCLPREGDHVPAQPPRSSGEWQLAADGIAIFVVGPVPSYCAVRGDVVVTIIAVVAEDTLAAIGDLPPSPRRFLVVSEDRE